MNMKVLAIAADMYAHDQGGAERHFVNVLAKIAPKLEKVTVLVGPDLSLKTLYEKNKNVDFVPISYPHVPNLFGFFYILFATPIAIFLTWKNKYDLVWAKQEYPQAQVGALVKMFCRVPLYVTCQNPYLHTEEFVFKGDAPQKIKSFLTNCIGPVVSWAFKRADVVAAVSQYSALLSKKIGARHVVVIPNGVDLDKLVNINNYHKKFGELRLITTSTLIPRNGIDTLIEACSFLPKNFKWKLTIVGDGPLRSEIESIIKKHKLNNNVNLLGMVDSSKIMNLLDEHSIFVRPSRAEGFGVSFAEAMARGLPIIGTPVGGIVDFLKDGETGLSVSVDNPKMLADAIMKLYQDRKLYEKVQSNAWMLIKNKYNWETIGKEVLSVFKSLVKDNDR